MASIRQLRKLTPMKALRTARSIRNETEKLQMPCARRPPRLISHGIRIAAIFVLSVLLSTSFAQQPKPNSLAPKRSAASQPQPPISSSTHELTAADLEAFLDGVMPLQLAREDIAGAVISVVKDGQVLFAKGYGYSDVEKKTPVSPETTLFRPGSISKTFTWTALMQQVELGKVDLDHDVNEYIDFKVPATFLKPITVRNLMTHTPGLDETVEELFVTDPKQLKPIGDYLKEHLPARIYEPGTIPAYSNYGATLAGYIVQRVSGEPFEQYIEDHIFKPLGMEHSTFRQPLPSSLEPWMSNGYPAASGPAKPFELVEPAPAGSTSVSAIDMTHFMIAHLQNGQYQGAAILRPETAKLMHSRQFALSPEINGMCLGFYEESRNGQRIIGHGGDTELFHSDMHLMPEAGVGFFISYNSAGKGEVNAREAVWHRFLDRYFPYQPPPAEKPATAAQDANAVSGRYISSRRSEDTILKVISVAGQAKVSVNPDGTISVSDLKDLNGKPKKLSEIGSLLFRDVNGQDHAAFVQKGGYQVLSFDFPPIVLLKAPWYQNSGLQVPLLIGSLIVLLLALILWPIAAILRRHYSHPLNLPANERRLRIWVRIVCLLDVIFVLGFVAFFAAGLKDIGIFSPRYNPLLRLIQVAGWLGVLGTLVAVYNMFRSWSSPQRWFWSKLSETAIALACIAFCWFVFTWNVLSWSLKY
jgi:CubicO group peptidase (beta-lactamase class C family)